MAQWVKANPLINLSASIHDLAAGNGVCVAVGKNGLIATYDTEGWHEHPSFTGNDLHSVIFTGTRFLAVGAQGLVIASDGLDTGKWTVIQSNTTLELKDIHRLNGNWYILGEQGLILRSANGNLWDQLHLGTTYERDFDCLTYFNNEFIALRRDELWRSTDGRSWSVGQEDTRISSPYGIDVLNGKLVAWGGFHELVQSADSVTWENIPSPLQYPWDGIRDVITSGGKYFLVGSDRFLQEDRPIYTSEDLNTWTETDGMGRGPIAKGDAGFFVATADNTVETSANGINWRREHDFLKYSTAYFNGHFRGISRNFLYSSSNGESWSASALPVGITGEGVYEANGTFITSNRDTVAVSRDLQTWQMAESPERSLGKDFLFAFGHYYARSISTFETGIYRSVDALNWSYHGTGYSVAFGNNRLVIVKPSDGGFTTEVTTSESTTTHTSIGTPTSNSITFGNGLFVGVSDTEGHFVQTSVDGITWTPQTVPATIKNGFEDICFANGRFVARARQEIATSTDGIHWQDISFRAWKENLSSRHSLSGADQTWLLTGGYPLKLNASGEIRLLTDITDQNFKQVKFRQGAFWALSDTTDNIITGTLWRSVDGMNWETITDLPFNPVGMAWIGTKLFVFDNGRGKIASSENTHEWEIHESGLSNIRSVADFAGMLYAGLQRGLYRSEDGITWERVEEIPENEVVQLVTSPLGLTARLYYYGTKIYHSIDGESWVNSYSGNTASGHVSQLAYIDSKLQAPLDEHDLLQSVNGLTWETVTDASNETLGQTSETNNYIYNLYGGALYSSPKTLPYIFGMPVTAGNISSVAHSSTLSVGVGSGNSLYVLSNDLPPTSPGDIQPQHRDTRNLTLEWSTEPTDIAGYRVQLRTEGEDTWNDHSYLSGEANSMTIPNLQPSTTYEIRIEPISQVPSVRYTSVETLLTTLTPREGWRRDHFGTIDNTGTAADHIDADVDGVVNLWEYAFDLDPNVKDSSPSILESQAAESEAFPGFTTLTLRFTCDAEKTDITYVVKESQDLKAWNTLGTSVGGERFTDSRITDPYWPNWSQPGKRVVEVNLTTNSSSRFILLMIRPN